MTDTVTISREEYQHLKACERQLHRARYVAQFGRRLLRIADPDMFGLSASDTYEIGWRGGWDIAPTIRRYHRAFDEMDHHD
jgi:hypothetical protein